MVPMLGLLRSAEPAMSRIQISFEVVQSSVFMHLDTSHSKVFLIWVSFVQVMVSYTNSNTAGRLTITAMSSSDNLIMSNKRATTHEGSTNSTSQHDNLMRELTRAGICSSDNPVTSSRKRSGQGLL